MSAHLFNIDNPRWKILRTKLTPTFTSGKMKMMFGTVCDVGEKFVKTLGIEAAQAVDNVIEVKDISARFTTDVIGSVSFGLDCSSLEDPQNLFRTNAKRLFDNPLHSAAFIQLALMFKSTARKLHVRNFRKDATDFFFGIVKDTIEYRIKNKVHRNDFLQLLIQMIKTDGQSNDDTEKFTIEEIGAQAFIFFLAG